MTTGRDKQEGLRKPLDALGAGQSYGVPMSGEVEGNSCEPMGNPGFRHWQTSSSPPSR